MDHFEGKQVESSGIGLGTSPFRTDIIQLGTLGIGRANLRMRRCKAIASSGRTRSIEHQACSHVTIVTTMTTVMPL